MRRELVTIGRVPSEELLCNNLYNLYIQEGGRGRGRGREKVRAYMYSKIHDDFYIIFPQFITIIVIIYYIIIIILLAIYSII